MYFILIWIMEMPSEFDSKYLFCVTNKIASQIYKISKFQTSTAATKTTSNRTTNRRRENSYVCVCVYLLCIYRVSQEECARLRESVP